MINNRLDTRKSLNNLIGHSYNDHLNFFEIQMHKKLILYFKIGSYNDLATTIFIYGSNFYSLLKTKIDRKMGLFYRSSVGMKQKKKLFFIAQPYRRIF
jgi:hypothetical protein